MTNTNKTLLVLVAALLVASTGWAAFSKVGTTGASFLKIGVGRASGMGNAFVALADDAAAAYYNPAGLSQVSRTIQFNHVDWIADISHEYLVAVLPIQNVGTIAFSATAVTMGDMEQTTIDNPNTRAREDEGTGLFFSASDFAVGVSYARIITDKLAFGMTVKGVNENVWDMSANALAVDLGLHYNTGFKSLRIGAGMFNYGTNLNFTGRQLDYSFGWTDSGPNALRGQYYTEGAPLPTVFRFGIAYDLVDAGSNLLTAAVDLTHPSDVNETINFGLEYGYAELFRIRAGYVLNTDSEYAEDIGWLTGLTAGVGLMTTPTEGLDVGLDYCFGYREYVKPTHRLLLTIGF